MSQNLKYILIALLVGCSDRLVKLLVNSWPKLNLVILELQTPQLNTKLSLSLPLSNQVAIILSLLTIVFLILLFNKLDSQDKCFFAAIIGAAFSNLIDRIFFGGVIDYINFLNISVINLADIIITLSVALIIYGRYMPQKLTS